MFFKELRDSLLRLKHIAVATTDEYLIISNVIRGFSAKVHFDEIDSFSEVVTPDGKQGIQLFYHYEGGLIVSTDDFIFDTQQGPFFTVPNLPNFCTLNVLIDGFLDYRQNPTPSIHSYKNITYYYLQKYLIDSAKAKGFEVSNLQSELQLIKQRTGLVDVFAHIEYSNWELTA